jgi:hypothetical protein
VCAAVAAELRVAKPLVKTKSIIILLSRILCRLQSKNIGRAYLPRKSKDIIAMALAVRDK